MYISNDQNTEIMGFSSYTIHLISQNRSLQKSMRAKYDQRLEVAVSGDNTEARLELSKLSKEQADYTRKSKLKMKALIAIFLFIPFAYIAYKWIDAYLISF